MGRLWWFDMLTGALAALTILTFLLVPALLRRWGDQGAGSDQAIEHMLHRLQVPLLAASVALLAAAIGAPLAERFL